MGRLAPDRRSNRGQQLSVGSMLDAAMPEPNCGCWIWLKASSSNGYGVIRHQRKNWFAHRLIYQLEHSVTVPDGIDVCHRCDNRLCVNPDHLFLGTRSENMQDCKNKGRNYKPNLRGEALPQTKLTELDVLAIRKDSRSERQLAKAYGVDKGTIGCIRRRLTWRHVT